MFHSTTSEISAMLSSCCVYVFCPDFILFVLVLDYILILLELYSIAVDNILNFST